MARVTIPMAKVMAIRMRLDMEANFHQLTALPTTNPQTVRPHKVTKVAHLENV
jgi:hypothetical protein